MKVILFGATGMIGEGALIEALEDPGVEEVMAVVRRPTGRTDHKLRELLLEDFTDYSSVAGAFAGYDACLYCLGVSSAGMSEADYRRVTYDFAIAAARALLSQNPQMRLCFVSGAGTDVNGRQMWARVKAETEAALLAMPWRSAHMFRPALIQPMKGTRSGVALYRVFYAALGWLVPFLKRRFPAYVTDTAVLGQAMLRVARDGHDKAILESIDINAVGA